MTTAPRPPHLRFATAAVVARIASMATGLLAIPFLIRYLGGENFAAWAILLAFSGGISLLELGLGLPVIRFLSARNGTPSQAEALLFFSRVWLALGLAFFIGGAVLTWVGEPFAAWTHLPATQLFRPAQALYFVYAMVALRALAQTVMWTWAGQRRLERVAVVSFVQSFFPSFAAVVTAWWTLRLDLALIAFWSTHVVAIGVAFAYSFEECRPRFSRASFVLVPLRDLVVDGIGGQLEAVAHYINFQFDKFIVAGLVGLWAVAPYEVANRAVAALRSAPVSGAETFLPFAMTYGADRDAAWAWYYSTLRTVVYGLFVFLLAPLTVAPVFLYAWTGEMGYVGRWVFFALCIGTVANVLALPAATLAQAAGRRGIPGRAALWIVLLNLPLSLLLVQKWSMVGAAVGTATAMAAGAIMLTVAVHSEFDRKLADTGRFLSGFWPLLLVCLLWGVMMFVGFDLWFAGRSHDLRFARATRVAPAIAAGLAFGGCLLSLFAVEVFRGRFSAAERQLLKRAFKVRVA